MAINIKINTDVSGVNDLKKSVDEVNKSVDNLNSDKVLNNLTENTKSLKTQLRETTQELQGLEPGTARFNELAIAAGKLKDTIADTNAVIKATAGSGVENLANGFSGVAKIGIGAFQGIASAQALFGVESEALQQTLVQLQAVAGLSDALKSLGGLNDTLTNVKASFNSVGKALGLVNKTELANAAATTTATAATGAQTTATGAATVASNALNISLLANPAFLIIATISALIGVMVYFGEETETAEQFNDKLNETLERQQGILDRQVEKTNRAADNRVKLLKAQGASEKEIFDAQQDQLRKEEDGRIKQLQNLEFTLQDKNVALRKAQSEGDDEQAKSILKEINATREKYKVLRNLDGQYSKNKQIAETQFTTDETKEQERTNEELRKKQNDAYKKRLEDQKKYNQERFDASRKIKDLELSLLEDGEVKEKQLAAEVTKRQLEDLQIKYGDYNKLNATLKSEFDKQSELLTIQGEQSQIKITEKFQKQREDGLKEGQDKLNKISLDSLEDGREKEVQVRASATNKELEDLDKLLEDKKITFEEYQDSYEKIVDKGNKDIDAINFKYDDARDDKAFEDGEKEKARLKAIQSEKLAILKSSLDEAANIFNQVGQDTGNAFAGALGNAFSQVASSADTFASDTASKTEKLNAGVQAVSAIATGFITASQEENAQKLEEGNQAIDDSNQKETESLQRKLDAGLISQAEFDKGKKTLDDKAVADKNAAGKKAFEESKKLQIAQAAISGLQGAIGAYTSLSSIPVIGVGLGIAAAAAVTAFTAKNIAKIKSSQYESASVDSGGGVAGGVDSVSNQTAQPSFNLFGQGNNANTVGPGSQQVQQNQNMTMTAQVSVTEINAVQNKVAVQESRSTL